MKKVHWWEDSFFRITCHENIPGKSASETILGEIMFKDNKWWYLVEGETKIHGPFETISIARLALEKAVGAEALNIWD